MFNLEQSIADWRKQMVAAGIKSPVPLEELEGHLREEIERQMRTESNAQVAFHIAAAQIGEAALLKNEFKKIKTERNMIKLMIIILALFGMVFGMSMVLPALGQWSRTGLLRSPDPLATGLVLVVTAGITAFYGIKTYQETRGRSLITLAIFAAGIFYIMPLILEFFQPDAHLSNWVFCGALAAASALFFGSCFYFNKRIPGKMAG
jgi:hypothetical protein